MVEVFKTNVTDETQALVLQELLLQHMPLCRVSFDLEDCDRVLRIEGTRLFPARIMELLSINGYECTLLE